MFGWLKKKPAQTQGHVPDVLKRMLEPMALAEAIASTIHDYVKAVKKGDITVPAYKRQLSEGSVVSVWIDTRYEALSLLFGQGADAMLLADFRNQEKLLDSLFNEMPHFEFPHQPSNNPIHDTLQAVFRIYMYLNEVGTAVGDETTCRTTVFSDFENQAKVLQQQWKTFDEAIRGSTSAPDLPTTLLELLYEDVTKKTKFIALSAVWGPFYMSNFNYFIESGRQQALKSGESAESINAKIQQVKSTMQRLLEAHDPDQMS